MSLLPISGNLGWQSVVRKELASGAGTLEMVRVALPSSLMAMKRGDLSSISFLFSAQNLDHCMSVMFLDAPWPRM
jgi:hypothetical protein